MAGMTMTPGKAGKKPLDAAINLVPFIDLLSCCISFLLITAVWTQLAHIDVVQRSQHSGDPATPEELQVKLTLDLNQDGYVLSTSTGEHTDIAQRGADLDYGRLLEVMRKARQEHPDVTDITVRPADRIKYDAIARTIDVLLGASFPNVALTPQAQAQGS